MLQNRQKTNISIRKNDKKPHQGKSANDLIKNKTSLIRNQISENKSGKNRVFRICICTNSITKNSIYYDISKTTFTLYDIL